MDRFAPEPIRPTALWEGIVESLRRAIILGELAPELHLEEPALAQKFGVSRIPIREALTRLAHEGLVRLEPRRGAFVVGATETDIHQIYEVRLLIEAHAIRRAAESVDEAGLDQLREAADQMAAAVAANQPARVAEPDVRFHRQIVIMANSRRLLAAWEPIGGLVATILSITNTHHRNMPGSVDSHRAMIRLLSEGDADGAEHELRDHLENGEAVMREAMRKVHRNTELVSPIHDS